MAKMNKCWNCKKNLVGRDLFEVFKEAYPKKTSKEIISIIKDYGWTSTNRLREKLEIAVEYPCIADGPAYYICPHCHKITKPADYWNAFVMWKKKRHEEIPELPPDFECKIKKKKSFKKS